VYTPTAAAAAASSAAVDSGGFKRGKWGKNDVLYGIINAIVGIPTMISFAAIVYQVRWCLCWLCRCVHEEALRRLT
jgi:hypothetical protein